VFHRRLIFRPLAGKGPALRDLLAARTLPGRWNLSERLAGPQPEFRVQLFYDSLTDLQQALEAARSQQPRADLGSLVAAAPALELEEVLTPVPPGPPPNYVSRVVYEYAPGKLHELRALLDELMQRRSAAGGRSNLTVRVSGGAPALSMAGFYQDLGALEATRAQALADPAGAERLQRIAALLARPFALPDIYWIVARSA